MTGMEVEIVPLTLLTTRSALVALADQVGNRDAATTPAVRAIVAGSRRAMIQH
jgi:hypothetical protein